MAERSRVSRRRQEAPTEETPRLAPTRGFERQDSAAPPSGGHDFRRISVLPPTAMRSLWRRPAVQRDADPDETPPLKAAPLPDTRFSLPAPPSISIPIDSTQGPGDFGPLPGTIPDPNGVAMAKRMPGERQVQRDDDDGPPHPAPDLQLSFPFQIQVSMVYRGFDLAHLHDFLGTLDIGHEPTVGVAVSGDPKTAPVQQVSVGVLNQHINLFGSDVQAQIVASVSSSLGGGIAPPQPGLGGQLEIPLVGPASLLFTYGGTYTPATRTASGRVDFSGSAGGVIHF